MYLLLFLYSISWQGKEEEEAGEEVGEEGDKMLWTIENCSFYYKLWYLVIHPWVLFQNHWISAEDCPILLWQRQAVLSYLWFQPRDVLLGTGYDKRGGKVVLQKAVAEIDRMSFRQSNISTYNWSQHSTGRSSRIQITIVNKSVNVLHNFWEVNYFNSI